ncbi:MAG: hypothetical protein WA956_10490 [Stenotrophomonas sp.]
MNLNSKLSVLFLSSFLSLTAWAEVRPGGEDCARIEPTPAQYSMIHPFHLPHVLRFIKDNGDDFRIEGSQQQAIDRLAAEVRGPTQSRQAEVGKLEREIAVAAFDGLDSRAQTERFDRLQRAKREIAEIHVDFVNRLRGILSPAQFALLRKLADR